MYPYIYDGDDINQGKCIVCCIDGQSHVTFYMVLTIFAGAIRGQLISSAGVKKNNDPHRIVTGGYFST